MTTDLRPANTITSFPPLFGVRRALNCPPLERIDFAARDGVGLCLHHTSGGDRGPVILAPGTAMTALSYCLDTVPCNFVEFLAAQGFDIWLFDWRTSPLLAAHEQPYTLDDVARYDWPAAVSEVQRRTGSKQVAVMAHCLSAPCFMLSLVRGYLDREQISVFIASQVGLNLTMTTVGKVKLQTRLDRLLPGGEMIHQKLSHLSGQMSDLAISVLAWILPKSYSCDNPTCHRHSASFGDLIMHARVNPATHAMMGDLIPECLTGFLKDVAVWGRKDSILAQEDMSHLGRLQLPIHLISGSENRMFVPQSTQSTYDMLCKANGPRNYQRTVYQGFGHLDCFVGDDACEAIWPDLAAALAAGGPPQQEQPLKVEEAQAGITFRETMAGGFAMGETDPVSGDKNGKHSGNILALHATIAIQNLDRFITDPDHTGQLDGWIEYLPFGTNIISKAGIFNLFSPAGDPRLKLMIYELGLEHEGQRYYLAGRKEIRDDPGLDLWKDSTTLFTTLHRGDDKTGPVIGAGILSLGPVELAKMVGTMRATGTHSASEQAAAVARFGKFFLGELWDSYVAKIHKA